MKVYLGPPSGRWFSEVHDRHMDLKYGRYQWDDNKDWEDRAWERLENTLQWIYNHTINLYLDKKRPTIKVKIHEYDTWSVDHTLAHIIVPLLKQLRDTKHGSPYVNDEDVPEELKSTSAPPPENDYDTDDNHHARWDWVLNEMIWAFEQKCREDWEQEFYKFEDDPNSFLGMKLVWEDREGREAHQERMSNGFRLFGKYYEALWD